MHGDMNDPRVVSSLICIPRKNIPHLVHVLTEYKQNFDHSWGNLEIWLDPTCGAHDSIHHPATATNFKLFIFCRYLELYANY